MNVDFGATEGNIEMWIRRRMMTIRWIDILSDEEALDRINENRTLLYTIIKGKDYIFDKI